MKKAILLSSLFILLLSCSNKSKSGDATSENNDSVPAETETAVESGVDEPTDEDVSINVSIMNSKMDDDRTTDKINFKMEDGDDLIKITPSSPYLDDYKKGKEFEFSNEYDVEVIGDEVSVPTIRLYIVNNSDKTFSTKDLEINVESSVLDDFPYMHFSSNSTTYPYVLQMRNDSWSNWESATLEYKLLKKGEKFNGKYDRKRTIPYFDNIYYLNFYDDIKSMGYNVQKVIEKTRKCTEDWVEYPAAAIWEDEDVDPELFSPFDYKEARIYGRLTFASPRHTIKFKGRIPLIYTGEGGAGENEDEKYGVVLRPSGKNYTIKYPYSTSIAPGGNEIVDLKMLCPKSAKHTFYIKINNDNGINVHSKPIYFYYLYPKNCYYTQNVTFHKIGK